MSQTVEVPDFTPPAEPVDDIDVLAGYLSERFLTRKRDLQSRIEAARRFASMRDIALLGYEAMLFRTECDEWYHFANAILDHENGTQLGTARQVQSGENAERGSRRAPSAEMVKAQAAQYTAPLKRAVGELKSTRDFCEKILSFCQSQQKTLASEEFGEAAFQASQSAPDEMFERVTIVSPPSTSAQLEKMLSRR